ncbi:MAG TPA: hypothetical protein VK708_04815 [Bryobacteraceae bacterium]|nr:hypothetical protein [Bryobacteraceae bacterium]
MAASLIPAGWWLARACAPDFLVAVFSYYRHPDLPRTEFIDGRLGVLQPSFARSYLIVAYRYLNGVGLSAGEREQARDYYKDRATRDWDGTGTDWASAWQYARARIQSPKAPKVRLITSGTRAYDPETHSFALNCAEDAFRIARQTLEERRRRFGATSQAFRSWVAAQDLVFSNCDGSDPAIPSPAAADLPATIRADREYQIAAAHFYAGQYDQALAGFRRIARDAASQWKTIARYLVVRTMLRMARNGKSPPPIESESKAILADTSLASIHGMTWNLMQRARIREGDDNYFRGLAALLSSKGQDNGLREELWNYTDMYDKFVDKQPADASRFRDADLSDWLFSFQARDSTSYEHAVERWNETQSPAWLLAALSHGSAVRAQGDGLVKAAATIPKDSPAYLTVQFHIQRIRLEAGDKAAVRESVAALLASPVMARLPSSLNLFRGLEMLAAPDLNEFLQFAVRKPVMLTGQLNAAEAPDYYRGAYTSKTDRSALRLDLDAVRILNGDTPYRLLRQAALSDALPPEVEREALMTAFARGLLLDQDLSEIATRLGAVQPDLAELTAAYLHESTAEGHRFAAAYLLLRRPEARPYFEPGITRQTPPGKLDNFRDNWWCPVELMVAIQLPRQEDGAQTNALLHNSTAKTRPAFLSPEANSEATRELVRLGKLGAATDFLSTLVFSYAKTHSDDSRIPEALHNLVRAGHYGCADTNTWKATREAFRMLHQRYPASEWTKRTPTWFKNDSDFQPDTSNR